MFQPLRLTSHRPFCAVCHRWRKLQYRWAPNCFLTHISHPYLASIPSSFRKTYCGLTVFMTTPLMATPAAEGRKCLSIASLQRTELPARYGMSAVSGGGGGGGVPRKAQISCLQSMKVIRRGFVSRIGSRGNASGALSKGALSQTVPNAFLFT
jgi:hypothetical protein